MMCISDKEYIALDRYRDNLCGWGRLRRFFFPFAWGEAENKARAVEYRLRCIEARLDKKEIPFPPNRIRMM